MSAMRFDGKVAVVTGGGSGIGRAAALALAAEGAALLVLDRNGPAAQATAQEIYHTGGRARAEQVDVTAGDAVAAAMAACVADLGGLEILVNAAGILGATGPVVDCSEEDWERVFAVNVKGTFLCSKHAVPHMRRARAGAIVNLASTAGLTGSALLGLYSASKGAVVLLTRSMALNHAAEGIRVNCVCPGSIATPMLDATFAAVPAGPERERLRELYRTRHPMGRFGQGDEVARAILFLASPEASFITGVALPVDGGRLA